MYIQPKKQQCVHYYTLLVGFINMYRARQKKPTSNMLPIMTLFKPKNLKSSNETPEICWFLICENCLPLICKCENRLPLICKCEYRLPLICKCENRLPLIFKCEYRLPLICKCENHLPLICKCENRLSLNCKCVGKNIFEVFVCLASRFCV